MIINVTVILQQHVLASPRENSYHDAWTLMCLHSMSNYLPSPVFSTIHARLKALGLFHSSEETTSLRITCEYRKCLNISVEGIRPSQYRALI